MRLKISFVYDPTAENPFDMNFNIKLFTRGYLEKNDPSGFFPAVHLKERGGTWEETKAKIKGLIEWQVSRISDEEAERYLEEYLQN